tara:strand:- start:24 stop:350 length:327 start_codon:yes stop_codon:yes gene_type:complete
MDDNKIDGRSNNGGNSTKVAIGKVDKRKNIYRDAISKVVTESQFLTVFSVLQEKALEGDLKAIQIYLDHTKGKPLASVEMEVSGNVVSIPTINFGNIVSTEVDSEDID